MNALQALGVNKIVMVDQLDSLARNKALAPLLQGVDVMVAGGGHERLGDSNDKPAAFNGHDADFISTDTFPILVNDKDGKPTAIVTTDTEYSYLGRLVVNFDSAGNIIPAALDNVLNGAYAATAETLKSVYGSSQSSDAIVASSSIGAAVSQVTTALENVISSKDSAVFGYTKVYLEGDRVFGRSQEVNLGNLTADANNYAAEKAIPGQNHWVSLKNGGGIRASIGSVDANGIKGGPVATDFKGAGAISKLEIENALRFDNKLMVFDTTPSGLLTILNFAAGISAGNGGFAQLGGVQFSYDPTKPAGSKVQDVALVDEGGRITSKIANDGVLLAGAPSTISVVTLNFLANGGDGYPVRANGTNFRYLLQDGSVSGPVDSALDFTASATVPATALGEQRALEDYLQTFHATPETAFDRGDTQVKDDRRIQNLSARSLDTVLIPVFANGVASGDPYRDSVILWTRFNPQSTQASSATINWEVSTSKDFAAGTIADRGSFTTDASRDWTVKVEADGLKAGTSYYYRFSNDGVLSPVGQTRTLASDAFSARIALFSCANFTATPEFSVYGKAAEINQQKPYDAWVHVGDYIYEYGKGGYTSAEGSAGDRGFEPEREIVTLEDYRLRYAQYHSDGSLQNLRQSAPLIAIWDDHETANDSYMNGAQNHQPATEGDWSTRVANAMQAYYEWMPIREPQLRDGTDQGTSSTPLTKANRSFDFGDVLSLHMLETRLTARDPQLSYPSSDVESALNVAEEAYSGERSMIGSEQLNWLQNELATSKAAWQALGSGTLFANMAIPAELLLNQSEAVVTKYATPLQKLANGLALSPEEQALFNEAGKIPYNLDAWDGYGAEREQIIDAALKLDKRLVSLAGDTHNAWSSVIDSNTGEIAGVEFAGPGVSSPGLESQFSDPYLIRQLFLGYVTDLRYAELEHRGFVDLTFTADSVFADYNYITGADPSSQQSIWSTDTLYTDASLAIAELKKQSGTIDFSVTTDRTRPVILDVLSTQRAGRLYDETLLPRAGDFRLRLDQGGFSADFPDYSNSRDVIQLEYKPSGILQEVSIDEKVRDESGLLESIANTARGLISGIINNYIHTRIGDDEIIGSPGSDFIRAGAGNDFVDAGLGNDLVRSGSGNDRVILGSGADQLLITRDQLEGTDTLGDFSELDRLVLADGISVIGGIGSQLLSVGYPGGNQQQLLLTDTSVAFWSLDQISSL